MDVKNALRTLQNRPFFVSVAGVLALLAVLSFFAIQAYGDIPVPSGDKEMWLSTSEAQARTAAGDCAAGEICKELCMINTFTGEVEEGGVFSCFPEY